MLVCDRCKKDPASEVSVRFRTRSKIADSWSYGSFLPLGDLCPKCLHEVERGLIQFFANECEKFPLRLKKKEVEPETKKQMDPPLGSMMSPLVPKDTIVITSDKKKDMNPNSPGYPEPPHT